MKKLDLHGQKVHDAWKTFNAHVELSYSKGFKFIIVVTGHGKMSEEIRGWVNGNPLTVAIEQDGNNTGSYRVKLKKNKPIQQKETKPSRLATSEDIARLVAKWNN